MPFDDLTGHAAPREQEPFQAVQRKNDRDAVRSAIHLLPPGERDAVTLFYLFGNSRDETARFLSISPDAVKKRLQRARTHLHKELLPMFHDDLEPRRPSQNAQFLRELQTQISERDAFAARIHAALAGDNRVAAAWFFTNTQSGDLAHIGGTENPWHPLHVQAVVKAETIEEFIAGRRDYAARVGTPLLLSEAPRNAPQKGAYLMAIYDGEAGPYEVDWYFEPLGPNTKRPQQVRLLFDHAGLPEGDKPTPFNDSTATEWDVRYEASLTPEQKRREEARNRTSVFWAMWLIAARFIVRQRNDEPLFLGEMLRGLLRETRQFVQDTKSQNDAPPLPVRAPEKVRLLREMARDMETLTPRIKDGGGDVPSGDAIIERAERYLRRVEEAVGSLDATPLGTL